MYQGGGTYCYGTYVTISASSSAGYDFTNWNNDSSMSLSSYGFYVNSGGTYTAYAKAGTIAVTFWRNTSASDSEKDLKELHIWRHQSGFSGCGLADGRVSYEWLGK